MEFQEFVCYGDHADVELALYDYGLDHPDTYADCDPTAVLHGFFPAFVGNDQTGCIVDWFNYWLNKPAT